MISLGLLTVWALVMVLIVRRALGCRGEAHEHERRGLEAFRRELRR